jgi:hypothetical protein
MTIQIELNSEMESRLAGEASLRGISPEQYASEILMRSLLLAEATKTPLTVDELHKMLQELGEGWEGRPSLPTSAFTRESFYEDRT